MREVSAGVFLLVLVALFGFWLIDSFDKEITVHRMFCPGGRIRGVCKSKEETANPTTYKAMVDQQTVVYWVWGSAPVRFTFCAVRDAANWSCKFEQADRIPSRDYQMVDGEYISTADLTDEVFYRTSRWHWWSVWLSEKIL